MLWKEIKQNISTIGVYFDAGGFGDRLQFASFPENFYRNTNLKLTIPFPIDCLAANPFVQISPIQPDLVIDLWFQHLIFTRTQTKIPFKPRNNFRSLAEKMLVFDDFKLYLNKPRLYLFEDSRIINLVVIHRTGKTAGEINDNIVDYIVQKYKSRGFNIGQIGGKEDRRIEGTDDFRGLNLFETANLISQSAVFIGVNSGMYHLASCYNIQKKVILTQYDNEEQLENFMPCGYNSDFTSFTESNYPKNSIWLDFSAEYYNMMDRDIGVTRSYLNI